MRTSLFRRVVLGIVNFLFPIKPQYREPPKCKCPECGDWHYSSKPE